MPERTRPILRMACIALAAVLVFQIAWAAMQFRPLSRVTIPELPSLPRETNNPGGLNMTMAVDAARGRGSNGPARGAMTNLAVTASGTSNAAAIQMLAVTNVSAPVATVAAVINLTSTGITNAMGTNLALTNVASANGTNGLPLAGVTNGLMTNVAGLRAGNPGAMRGGMAAGGRGIGSPTMGGVKPVELPPAIQARVNRIIDSELLGTVMHPQPMMLIGIAGNQAILRTPSGQTGLVKEGDELGGVKLLSIGINRVLVEDQGEKKELMIFAGFGSDSLLSKQDTSHETNK